jgi:hypothetical protein
MLAGRFGHRRLGGIHSFGVELRERAVGGQDQVAPGR